GPGGTNISSPAGVSLARGSNYLLIDDPANGTANVLLAHPKAGTYHVTTTDASNPITGVQTAHVLAPFSGHGTVTRARAGKRRLRLRYVLPTGATLSLVERGNHVERTLARNVHGSRCPGRQRHVTGGKALCFTTTFTPATGAGGRRSIEAVVQRGGIPMTIATVAHYRAPALRVPSKPRKVQIKRSGTTVKIAWTASSGAAHYAVSATTSTGRSLSFTPAPRCRAVRIAGLAKSVKVSAVVEGIRYDTVHGHPARATLKAGKASGGAKGKLKGPVCSA
ncbi:MAG TPA: hypothetical protein VHX88_12485, partial [Solirubrobacteraceae bacterium]|nr:hypothetical protein [Solirubrobacteraceae bacterium]